MGIEDIKLNIIEGGDDIPGDIYREVLIKERMLNYALHMLKVNDFWHQDDYKHFLRKRAINDLEEDGRLVWPKQ